MWLILVLGVILHSGLVIAEEKEEMMQKTIQTCKEQENPSEEDLTKISNREIPESKQGKCMMACVMIKNNVMDEQGMINLEGSKAFIDEMMSGNSDDKDKMKKIFQECSEEVEFKEGEKCENAEKTAYCTHRKMEEMGMKSVGL